MASGMLVLEELALEVLVLRVVGTEGGGVGGAGSRRAIAAAPALVVPHYLTRFPSMATAAGATTAATAAAAVTAVTMVVAT
ncbi:unnamed protein product [Closterium sp. NIES-54]